MTNFLIRKTGNDNYGGTSPTLLATFTASSSGSTVTATTSVFTPSHVGQAMRQNNVNPVYVITAYISATQVTVSGTPSWSSTTVNLGGAWAGINQYTCNGNNALIPTGSNIYIGAGVWGVQLTGPTGGQTASLIADTSGQYTTDAGEVIFTAFSSGSKTVPGLITTVIAPAGNNLTFSGFTVIGGATLSGTCLSSSATGITFTDCVFNALAVSGAYPAVALANSSAVPALAHTFERCVFIAHPTTTTSAVLITLFNNATSGADYNTNIVFRNCLVQSFGATGGAIAINSSGANTYKGGGVTIYDSTIMGPTYGVWNQGTNLSTTVANTVYNSMVVASSTALQQTGGLLTDGGYNVLYASTAGVTTGTGSILNNIEPRLELGQSTKITGLTKPFLSPLSGSPFLGNGSAGTPPVVDFLNRPKPSGGGSGSAATGYLELHDFAIQDTSVYPPGYTSSAKLVGPGDQYLLIPVDAIAHQFSIQLYQGSGYTPNTYTGTSTSVGGTRLTASAANWITNQWAGAIVTSGGVYAYVASNDATNLYLNGTVNAWSGSVPSTGSFTISQYGTATILANGELGISSQIVSAYSTLSAWQTLTFSNITPSKAGFITLQVTSYDTSGTGTLNFGAIT